jgi:4-hydroxy-2-oxoheptanedioate aldolase
MKRRAGIGGTQVGPSDLGLSLGMKPMIDREQLEIFPNCEKLAQVTRRRGQFTGIHNTTDCCNQPHTS